MRPPPPDATCQDLDKDPVAPPDVRIVFSYQEEVLVNVPIVLVPLALRALSITPTVVTTIDSIQNKSSPRETH